MFSFSLSCLVAWVTISMYQAVRYHNPQETPQPLKHKMLYKSTEIVWQMTRMCCGFTVEFRSQAL